MFPFFILPFQPPVHQTDERQRLEELFNMESTPETEARIDEVLRRIHNHPPAASALGGYDPASLANFHSQFSPWGGNAYTSIQQPAQQALDQMGMFSNQLHSLMNPMNPYSGQPPIHQTDAQRLQELRNMPSTPETQARIDEVLRRICNNPSPAANALGGYDAASLANFRSQFSPWGGNAYTSIQQHAQQALDQMGMFSNQLHSLMQSMNPHSGQPPVHQTDEQRLEELFNMESTPETEARIDEVLRRIHDPARGGNAHTPTSRSR